MYQYATELYQECTSNNSNHHDPFSPYTPKRNHPCTSWNGLIIFDQLPHPKHDEEALLTITGHYGPYQECARNDEVWYRDVETHDRFGKYRPKKITFSNTAHKSQNR